MKYTRLTKEQFEELHPEFINFLATQSITGKEWSDIKEKQPDVAEQELDVFSDLIWEGVLSKAKFLQNSAPNQLFLFKLAESEMHLIMVKVNTPEVNLTMGEGMKWLQENLNDKSVELFTATKVYSKDKNGDIFELIMQGATIVDGILYEAFSNVVSA